MSKNSESNHTSLSRRDILKGLATVPVIGIMGAGAISYQSEVQARSKANKIPDFGTLGSSDVTNKLTEFVAPGNKLRIGIIGNGSRGLQLLRALGFADPDWVEKNTPNGKANANLKNFLQQEDLNVEITAICDTFRIYAEIGADAVQHGAKAGARQIKETSGPKLYHNYRDLLADDLVDAVVIATPDHWHARMAIDAALAGKHVYLEKPMTLTIEEAFALREAIFQTGVTFQLGHQNRQQVSYRKAEEVVAEGLLGDVSMIETYTNRNNDHGAWIRGIHPEANRDNIDWEGFLGSAPATEFDLDRYFNWQKWFEYGGGPAGNQFTHEYDCINQVMHLGIPNTVVATGGNYHFKDPRNIPDVFNAVFNYANHGLTLTYDCTLKSKTRRDKLIMGTDASMVLSINLNVFPDNGSEKYKKFNLDPEEPVFSYNPKQDETDATTSATAKYYQERGFGYTYRNGKKVDCTYLHMLEWINCIRTKKLPSCNVQQGFEESVTYIMSNISYREQRVVKWNQEKEMIV